jgi:hypothetical protein
VAVQSDYGSALAFTDLEKMDRCGKVLPITVKSGYARAGIFTVIGKKMAMGGLEFLPLSVKKWLWAGWNFYRYR